MKIISYSLFDSSKAQPWEKISYIRGFYFNVRFNNLLFPEWQTHLEVDIATYKKYQDLFNWLVDNSRLIVHINDIENVPLCAGMIWRLKPIFKQDVSHVLSRDSDSLTSYREALVIQKWLESGKKVSAILDNRAHSGLMGGMVGFETSYLKACMETNSWEQLINEWDFSQRGSDQNWMNAKMQWRIKDEIMWFGSVYNKMPDQYASDPLPGVNQALWEANLAVPFIGSPGFNEMEALRFLKRFDQENYKYSEIESQFKTIFWWHNV